MYSKSLCCLDMMITPKIRMTCSLALKHIHITSPQVFYLFVSWTTRNLWFLGTDTIPKHFIFIKDLTRFKQRIYSQNDAKNRNPSKNKKCRFCDFSGSQITVQNHDAQIHRDQVDERDQYELESQQIHLRFTNQQFEMPAPVVVYADFELAITEKNRHNPIMLSCLDVSRIPTIHTQLQVFHAPHEEESDLRSFMDYLIQLQESVKRHLFNEMSLVVTLKVDKDYRFISVYPFCHKKLESNKVRHHAHVAGEYSNGVEVKHYDAGQYIFTCCQKCNL